MDLVQIKIEKDDNIVSYIKIIRDFEKEISCCINKSSGIVGKRNII